jgi:hypothetical protein
MATTKQTTHTPERWEVDRDGIQVCVITGTRTVAVMGYGGTRSRAMQNARLIAAAPDLLAALEKVVRYANECKKTGHVFGVEWEDIISARAAIARAKGVE